MALRLALDTNRYVDFCKGDESATRVIARAQQIVMPFAVLAELRAGFRRGAHAAQNEKVLARFLQAERVSVLFADEGTTFAYAALFSELRAAGTPIPTNDLWIASLALQHDLVLFSHDTHFDCVPRLARI